MKEQRKKGWFFVLLLGLLFLYGCAGTGSIKGLDLQAQLEKEGVEIEQTTKLPGQVIVYRDEFVPGLTVEYGVLCLSSKEDGQFDLTYLDPAEEQFFSEKDIHVYFKFDISNQTEKNISFVQRVELESGGSKESNDVESTGGNHRNSTFYFYAPIPKRIGAVSKTTILMTIEGNMKEFETFELICSKRSETTDYEN